tara:strand:+ start:1610 stop:2260 length:651 start_codon:yes stop_codon:yes gene_type:complete
MSCVSSLNGETHFFNNIKPHIDIIFDVGSRSDSDFLEFVGEVHYFDPNHGFMEKLKKMKSLNTSSYHNTFGLGNTNSKLNYYPKYQSFYDRIKSCKVSDDVNKIVLQIQKGKDYMIENKISKIDFMKIDTEGYELEVLKGFEDYLQNIMIIQFEYGGTYIDSGNRLLDVVHLLENKGFENFSYLSKSGPVLITNFKDTYKYCNIVCINKTSKFVPF